MSPIKNYIYFQKVPTLKRRQKTANLMRKLNTVSSYEKISFKLRASLLSVSEFVRMLTMLIAMNINNTRKTARVN